LVVKTHQEAKRKLGKVAAVTNPPVLEEVLIGLLAEVPPEKRKKLLAVFEGPEDVPGATE